MNSAIRDKPRILFASYAVAECGAHQYGRNIFSAISQSVRFRFEYADILGLKDLDCVVGRGGFAAVIVNYHPTTMPFIKIDMPRRYGPPCIAIMHGMTPREADVMPQAFFQNYIMGDPTLKTSNPRVFATGRLIPAYQNTKPLPDVVTIGSFGFAQKTKGFLRLINAVQEEFDEAVIRLNIPPNGVGDPDAALARGQAELCRRSLWKPGIRLEATHEFFDIPALIDFLAANTVNALLYDYIPDGGISSAADHAMAARRPLAITRSSLFRHLHDLNPPITIEDRSIKDIISAGARPFDHLLREWSPESICRRYEYIIEQALAFESRTKSIGEGTFMKKTEAKLSHTGGQAAKFFFRVLRAIRRRWVIYLKEPAIALMQTAKVNFLILLGGPKPPMRFNRILDDSARVEHAAAIRRLAELDPAVFAKKIPRANIQQGFIFDAVRHFAKKDSKILCVGSYQDTAANSLKAEGYAVEDIDPNVNHLDLNAFFNLPTTKRGSYDIVFSTSVIEHVKDDEKFVAQMAELLAPWGVGVLTCDFMESYHVGAPIFEGNYRFYTKERLLKIAAMLRDCELVDAPVWECPSPDFYLGGFNYTFATLAFRKRGPSGRGA